MYFLHLSFFFSKSNKLTAYIGSNLKKSFNFAAGKQPLKEN